MAVSVWAIRRIAVALDPEKLLGPAAGRNPAAVAASRGSRRYGELLVAQIRSSGSGAAEPAASRMSISSWTGTLVRSAASAKVMSLRAENRS